MPTKLVRSLTYCQEVPLIEPHAFKKRILPRQLDKLNTPYLHLQKIYEHQTKQDGKAT